MIKKGYIWIYNNNNIKNIYYNINQNMYSRTKIFKIKMCENQL